MEFANGVSFDHPHGGSWSKLAPFVILGPVPLLAKRSSRLQSSGLASAPSHGEACSFAAVSDEPSRLPVVGDSVFCLPLGLWLECSNAQMGLANSNERKKGHWPAPTPLNEMRFLSHGPIVRVEHNEARSVMETPSGLLSAMRVLSRADRLSFVQAVAPCFAGHDAFRWLRRVMPVARHLVGCAASWFGNRFVWCPPLP